MKKTLTFITAMLISCSALASCGGSSGDGNKGSAKVSTSYTPRATESTTTEVEKTVIDPFENISYQFVNDYTFADSYLYPEYCGIEFDASNAPLGAVSTYTYFIESANESGIVVKARANIDEYDVTQYLEENNLAIEENEKTFTISTSELKTSLLSADYLDEENKALAVNTMKNFVNSTANEYFEYYGLYNSDTEFTLEKIYLMMPTNIEYTFHTQKAESKIRSYTDESQFEDVEKYENKAVVGFKSSETEFYNNAYYGVYGIFENNDVYHTVELSSMIFENGVLISNEENCHFMPDAVYTKDKQIFSSLEEAYENGPIFAQSDFIEYYDVDENYFTITELPID